MRAFGFEKAAALAHVAVGIVATALPVGCSSSSAGQSGPSTKEQTANAKAAISGHGFTVNGCQAHGLFDITSPQAIDFVAMDGSDLAHAQLQLYTVDAGNEQSPVQRTAQKANPQVQALLDGAGASAGSGGSMTLHASMVQVANSSTNGSSSTTHTSTSTSASMTFHQSTSTSGSAGQVAAQGSGGSTGSSASSTSVLVFDDLSQLGSKHLVLVVDATAKQMSTLLRVFEGSGGIVTAVQSFPVITTTCSGVSANVPAITPVAVPQRPRSPGGNGGE